MKRTKYPVYCSTNFNWTGKRGGAEASDLSPVVFDESFFPNGASGFFVISKKTKVKLFFTEVVDEDGYDGEMNVYSSGDIFITIFND